MQKIKTFILSNKIIVGVIIIAIIFGAYSLFNKKTSAETRYVTNTAQKGSVTQIVSGTGQVDASNTIDLQQATPYPTTEIVTVQINMTGCANGLGPTNSKNINGVIQVSSDNSNWANSTLYATPLLVSGATANGLLTAATTNIKLAPGEKRYIRAQFTGEAGGGTPNNAVVGGIQLLF